MAYQPSFSAVFSPAAKGSVLDTVTARFGLFMRRRKAYRETFSELNACSSRDLNDLGIARSDIRRLAIEAADAVT